MILMLKKMASNDFIYLRCAIKQLYVCMSIAIISQICYHRFVAIDIACVINTI